MTMTGRIIRLNGGFYTVRAGETLLECRARGLFRKQGVAPCVGDMAVVEPAPDEPGKGTVIELLPRRNALARPPVANVDRLVLVLSALDPPPNLTVADRLLALAEHQDIDAAVVITKADRAGGEAERYRALYRGAGYETACVDALTGEGIESVRAMIAGNLCVLCGNTGVGKSTLLNALDPALDLKTGETSRKLGRGRHTTRVTELFETCGGVIADTPGFSSVETAQMGRIRKEELELCFREFAPYLGKCRFTGCSHTGEKGCAILEAERAGALIPSRCRSYEAMYDESKAVKDWEV